jgi:hypothetical protein
MIKLQQAPHMKGKPIACYSVIIRLTAATRHCNEVFSGNRLCEDALNVQQHDASKAEQHSQDRPVLLGNGSVSKSLWQRIHMQQQKGWWENCVCGPTEAIR